MSITGAPRAQQQRVKLSSELEIVIIRHIFAIKGLQRLYGRLRGTWVSSVRLTPLGGETSLRDAIFSEVLIATRVRELMTQ